MLGCSPSQTPVLAADRTVPSYQTRTRRWWSENLRKHWNEEEMNQKRLYEPRIAINNYNNLQEQVETKYVSLQNS